MKKCGKLVNAQTKGALRQLKDLTINQLAAFMATYYDGEGLILSGYCHECQHSTYFEIKPVTVERVDDPYVESV